MSAFQIILTIVLSIISAILYRMGGYGKPFNKLYRRIGCSLISTCLVIIIGIHAQWWLYILYAGASYGVLTTYWDKWGTDDVEWYEWALTGFAYAASAVMLCIGWGHWIGFSIRCVVLTVFTWGISAGSKNVWVEELGRGVVFTATIPLLLI